MWGERCGRVHGVNKEVCWDVGGGQGSCGKRYGGCGGRCRKMCWGVGEGKERCVGSGEVWGGCGKVYGVSEEVCWRVGKGCGEGNGEDVRKCAELWGPNTLLIPHISLPSPFPTSPLTSPTPHQTFLHLLSYLFPHPSFLPPHPNTFSYYPHISLHLLKVWRSYWQPGYVRDRYMEHLSLWFILISLHASPIVPEHDKVIK